MLSVLYRELSDTVLCFFERVRERMYGRFIYDDDCHKITATDNGPETILSVELKMSRRTQKFLHSLSHADPLRVAAILPLVEFALVCPLP